MRRRSFLAAGLTAALPLPAIAQSERSRVLKFVPQAGLSVLDPIWTTAAVVNNFGFTVFDTLYGIDAQLQPKPQMAEGATFSDDGLLWTIKLRDGLRFHDNEPVRAIDCVASLKRWGSRDSFGLTVASYVDEWKTVDDKTFSIRLKKAFPLMLFALAKPASSAPFIMPERLAMTDPGKQVPEVIGSGPFKFVAGEFNAGSRAVFAKFDGYVPRQEAPVWTSGGKVAHFDRVEWQVIPDSATAFGALKQGEVDWWEQVQADLIPALRADPGIVLGNGDPTGYVGIIRFNMLQAPFNNPKLRAAVMQAVTQSDYMRAITAGDQSAYRVGHSMYPAGTPYAKIPLPDPMSDAPDLDHVRTLVKDSGYGGEKIVIINPSDFPTIEPMGQITADLLKRIGLNVELAETDWGTVIQRRASRESVDKGGWSIFHTWWNGIAVTLPPMNSYIRGQGPSGWFGWFSSPQMESLSNDWLAAATDDQRQALAMQMQTLAFAEAPAVPLGSFYIRTAMRSDLSGLVEGPAPFPWGLKRTP